MNFKKLISLFSVLALVGLAIIVSLRARSISGLPSSPSTNHQTTQVKLSPSPISPAPILAQGQTQVIGSTTAAGQPVKAVILLYHYIRVVPNPNQDKLGVNLSVSPDLFEKELRYLKERHYQVVNPETLFRAIRGQTLLPPQAVMLTFDDGYEDFYQAAFPLLKKFNLPSTLFMVAGFVDKPDGRYLTSEQLRGLDQSGLVTIGVHSFNHLNLTDPKVNLDREVTGAKDKLENLLGHPLTFYAYPAGRYNDQVLAAVRSAGFTLAVSTDPGSTHSEATRYRLARRRVGPDFASFLQALGDNKSPSP